MALDRHRLPIGGDSVGVAPLGVLGFPEEADGREDPVGRMVPVGAPFFEDVPGLTRTHCGVNGLVAGEGKHRFLIDAPRLARPVVGTSDD